MAALTLGSAILGSAIVGSGAAIYAGSQQNKAIKNAANQQAQAAQQSINFAREGRDYAKQVLSKYSVEGDAARSKMNTFLGIKPTASQYSGAMSIAGQRVPEDVSLPGDTLDVPQEWLDTLTDLVGARTAQSFQLGAQPAVIAAEQRGAGNLNELLGYDRNYSVRFTIASE